MGVSKETTFRVLFSAAIAYEIAKSALNTIKAVLITAEPEKWLLYAGLAKSHLSSGEELTIIVHPNDDVSSDIHVTSQYIFFTTFDWGKNQQNIVSFQTEFMNIALSYKSSVSNTSLKNASLNEFDEMDDGAENVEKNAANDNLPSVVMTAKSLVWGATSQIESEPKSALEKPLTHRIFISYRRSDSRDVCGRIHDRLVRDLREENIFKDVNNIPFGIDFVEHLNEEVQKCTVLLAVIGREWIDALDETGARRLDDPNDFVRIEIEAALARKILVVPVLVNEAKMPPTAKLPESLRPLTRRNGIEVRPDPDFHNDMTRLLSRLG